MLHPLENYMNDLIPQEQSQNNNPFSRAVAANAAGNVGAISIESERAIAEAQGQMILAKRFPRDLNAAHANMMIACKSPAFAEIAFYSKPQGGKSVTGPSIRMAEQLAQVVGNFQYGHRELSRDDKKSEVEVFAWDMEMNNYAKRQKTIMHVIDTRDGPKKMRDQAQVDQKINNIASKEMRGLIIAMMPKWLVEDAIRECYKTIAGNNEEPIESRVRRMVQAFAKFGVKPEHLEKYLGHKLDSVMIDELVDLTGIHTALRDGAPPSEFFSIDDAVEDGAGQDPAVKAITAAAAKPAAAAAATRRSAASKPAESASKKAEDAAPAVAEKAAAPAEKEAAAAPAQASAPAADDIDAGNAAAAAAATPAGEEGDVF